MTDPTLPQELPGIAYRDALAAVLHRTGPVSVSPDDLDLALGLELIVSESPFGDPPGSKIFAAVDPDSAHARSTTSLVDYGLPPGDRARALAAQILAAIDR